MKYAVVTGADNKYMPGVIALYNSIKRNSDITFDLYLLGHGTSEDFKNLPNDLNLYLNYDPIKSPTSSDWPVSLPAMYSRILIPRILKDYDRALWLDADVIVLKDLKELLEVKMGDKACAACSPANPLWGEQFNYLPIQLEEPDKYPEVKNIRSISARGVLFDINNWHKQNLDEKIDNILLSDIKFKYVVQGVLSWLLKGNYKQLDYKWNCYVSWVNSLLTLDKINILHYVGGRSKVPWLDNFPHKNLWLKYYNKGQFI